jgi:hypothetical protein
MPRSFMLLSVALLAGCYTNVSTSSSKYLVAAQSTATVATPVDATALEVVRLFATRDASMVDRQPGGTPGSVVIKLTKKRGHLGQHTIDSVYYARVDPTATGSKLSILGKAAIDGNEPCTTEVDFQVPCTNVSIESTLSDSVTGYEEAQVIHGVLSELSLATTQIVPDQAATTAANARAVQEGQAAEHAAAERRAACEAQRHDISTRAEAMTDLDARGKLLQTMPNCDVPSGAP